MLILRSFKKNQLFIPLLLRETPVKLLGSVRKSIAFLITIAFKQDRNEYFIINFRIVFPDLFVSHMGGIQLDISDRRP